jgi:competence protein ComEA
VVTPSGPGPAASGTSIAGGALPAGPIDLNRATVDELDRLPGVGPATAAAIVAHRDEFGPFASVDDLLDVRGIGPAKLDAIRTLIRV